MKRYQTFEWIKMPEDLRNEFSDTHENHTHHYGYVIWDIDGKWFDEKDQPFVDRVNAWLTERGLELEDGKLPEEVLILIDW
jgi:hypothetical protein